MSLTSFVQEASLRILLILAISTPTILLGWFACRRLQISATAKVKFVRFVIVKSLVFDVLLVGVLGMFTSCLAFPRFWVVAVPDAIPALVVNGYLVGSIGMLGSLLMSLVYAERIRSRASNAHSQARQQALKLLSKFGNAHRVMVRESNEVHCISLAGLFRPTLIIPTASPEVKQTEILHEISHVINRDLAWTLMARLFQVILFPLPWTHWLVAEVILWQEIRADEMATRNSTSSRLELAESILRAISHAHSPLLSMSGQGKNVARRLNFLYKPVNGNRTWLGAVCLMIMSMMPLPLFQIQVYASGQANPAVRMRTGEIFTGSDATATRLEGPIASKSALN